MSKKTRKKTTDATRDERLSDQIRRLLDTCGVSMYRIAALTGLAESNLSRFRHGHQGVTLNNLDRLARVLNWRIVADDAEPPNAVSKGRGMGKAKRGKG